MTQYLVVIERDESNFSAYVPDLPGCVAAGDTKEETMTLMRAAVRMHIDGLQEEGLLVPTPSTTAEYLAG